MVITRTPFRISFFGGGTDYPAWYKERGGAVLSASIDKYCYLNVRHLPPFFDYRYRVRYAKNENAKAHDEIEHPSARECLKFLDVKDGIEIQHTADLPAMSGLGSSSAFTVGLLHALYSLRGTPVSKLQLARDAIHVEQECIKEHVGSQDQVAAAFGGLNRIEFRGNHEITVAPVVMPRERLEELARHLMLFFTGFSRRASDIAATWIKNTPRNERELARMGEMVREGALVLEGGKDLRQFGALLKEAWELKRGLSPEIANGHVDEIYQRGMRAGALGGKLLGAGGGGFILFFVAPEKQAEVKKALADLLYVPFAFENRGSHVIFLRTSEEEGVAGV
jgi:D-glycero-alpha-D-manno-heptose-7-phosphate kinase